MLRNLLSSNVRYEHDSLFMLCVLQAWRTNSSTPMACLLSSSSSKVCPSRVSLCRWWRWQLIKALGHGALACATAAVIWAPVSKHANNAAPLVGAWWLGLRYADLFSVRSSNITQLQEISLLTAARNHDEPFIIYRCLWIQGKKRCCPDNQINIAIYCEADNDKQIMINKSQSRWSHKTKWWWCRCSQNKIRIQYYPFPIKLLPLNGRKVLVKDQAGCTTGFEQEWNVIVQPPINPSVTRHGMLEGGADTFFGLNIPALSRLAWNCASCVLYFWCFEVSHIVN